MYNPCLSLIDFARTIFTPTMCSRRRHSHPKHTNTHNFKSQIFKLRVSNPKNKYVACLSVLSRISNCQGLGRKSKHEILKTDRMCQLCNMNPTSLLFQ